MNNCFIPSFVVEYAKELLSSKKIISTDSYLSSHTELVYKNKIENTKSKQGSPIMI